MWDSLVKDKTVVSLIFNTGIHILVRQHLYIETVPWWLDIVWKLKCLELCANKASLAPKGLYIHPSPKVMADFFQKQASTWCPHPICTIFGGCIKCMQVFIFCAKYIDFLHWPVLHGGSKCRKRDVFQIKFEHHRLFPVEICRIQVKFLRLQTWYVSFISPKFHGDWPHCYKTNSK